MFMRLDNSFNAADFPAPRPPQTRTEPFRRRVFSALSRSLSMETILWEGAGDTDIVGEGSEISRPSDIVQSSGVRG